MDKNDSQVDTEDDDIFILKTSILPQIAIVNF